MGFDPRKAANPTMPVRQRPSVRVRVRTTMTAAATAIDGEGHRALPLSDLRGVVRVTG